jgi:hypothetical protein
MRLLKKAKCTLMSGGPDSGWRPDGTPPYTTEAHEINLEIRGSDEGFFLVSIPANDDLIGDTWHASLEEALSQAELQFGVPSTAWQDESV